MTESGDAPVVNTSKFYSEREREREREIFYHIRTSEMKPLLLQRNDHRPLLTRSRTGIRRLSVSKSISRLTFHDSKSPFMQLNDLLM